MQDYLKKALQINIEGLLSIKFKLKLYLELLSLIKMARILQPTLENWFQQLLSQRFIELYREPLIHFNNVIAKFRYNWFKHFVFLRFRNRLYHLWH